MLLPDLLLYKEREPEEHLGRANGRMPKLQDDLMQKRMMEGYIT